jgi:alpha-L-rhamnosidase
LACQQKNIKTKSRFREDITMVPIQLRCEYLSNPLGLDEKIPRLSWEYASNGVRRGQRQSAYRILVASTAVLLARDQGDLWDSAKTGSDATAQIEYGGTPLKTGMRCFWKVKSWDEKRKTAGWSEEACWTMGLLNEKDWRSKWIGLDDDRDKKGSSIGDAQWIWYPEKQLPPGEPVGERWFRRTVEIPAGAAIKAASIQLTADNHCRLYVNGKSLTKAHIWISPRVINLKNRLHPGKNIIAVQAGDSGGTPNPAGFVAAIDITLATGEVLSVTTNKQWKTSKQEVVGWKEPDFDDRGWRKAREYGLFGCEPWGKVGSSALHLPPPRYLRGSFVAKKSVHSATVYASALGIYELHLNGERVGEDSFTPGWTDYDTRVYYNTYDVTALVAEGENTLGAILADGWYSGYVAWGRKREHYGVSPRLRTQLHVEYEDGTSAIFGTDRSWQASTGPLLEADILMGESYDARKAIPGWDRNGFDTSAWKDVQLSGRVRARVQAYPGNPVRKYQEIRPVSVTEPKPGRLVFDMGCNFTGHVRLKVQGVRGKTISLRFAERLKPDGTVYTTNLREARATDSYICRGDAVEIWEPRFTFHGFQYVEVRGYPGKPMKDAITGVEMTSSTPVAGTFKCANTMANKLYANLCRTQRGNFLDVPTDCPQRDERLGWSGDAQVYVRTAVNNMDVSAFFKKWLVDLEDAQTPDGAFPDVAPNHQFVGGGTAAWGDAGVICPWTIYEMYGDTRVLQRHYKAMTRWIDYCKTNSEDLIRPAKGYGDWLSINDDTPKDLLATAYFAYSTWLTARVAQVLGKPRDVKKYGRLFERIRTVFNKAFVSDQGVVQGGSQTAYVLALRFDLRPEDLRAAAADHLLENIASRNYTLSTGFVGTKDLMMTLNQIGRSDVAWRLFRNDTFPSWGYSIKHGATSIWERWDGWTAEKGFQDPSMNSFAHYSLGAVGEWMFKTIGGIDTEGPGFRHVIIRPQPDAKMKHARVGYRCIGGVVDVSWSWHKKDYELSLSLPPNCVATVHIPAQDVDQVKEGRGKARDAAGVKFICMEEDAAVFRVGSGAFTFISKGVKP